MRGLVAVIAATCWAIAAPVSAATFTYGDRFVEITGNIGDANVGNGVGYSGHPGLEIDAEKEPMLGPGRYEGRFTSPAGFAFADIAVVLEQHYHELYEDGSLKYGNDNDYTTHFIFGEDIYPGPSPIFMQPTDLTFSFVVPEAIVEFGEGGWLKYHERYSVIGLHALFEMSDEGIGQPFSLRISAVPEPSTWAMMIVGFGLLGASLRRRHQGLVPGAQAPVG